MLTRSSHYTPLHDALQPVPHRQVNFPNRPAHDLYPSSLGGWSEPHHLKLRLQSPYSSTHQTARTDTYLHNLDLLSDHRHLQLPTTFQPTLFSGTATLLLQLLPTSTLRSHTTPQLLFWTTPARRVFLCRFFTTTLDSLFDPTTTTFLPPARWYNPTLVPARPTTSPPPVPASLLLPLDNFRATARTSATTLSTFFFFGSSLSPFFPRVFFHKLFPPHLRRLQHSVPLCLLLSHS